MLIGLLSDTHDNLPFIERAVEFFKRENVDFILHAGDFVAPFSLKSLQNSSIEWRGVFGNNDGDKSLLRERSQGRIVEPPLFLELESRKIALVHQFQELEADVIVFGHTHNPSIEKRANILLVNPGETGAWLSGRSTVGILDTQKLEAKIFTL